MVRPSGFEPETARLEGECSIQLSYERRVYSGAPERSRTPSPQIRSLMLYPIELLAQMNLVAMKDGVGNGSRTHDLQSHNLAL